MHYLQNYRQMLMKWALLCAVLLLAACGTPYATMKNITGQDVMLLGHDPVAYFTKEQSVRGNPVFQSTLPGRTYYFLNAEHKRLFDAAPEKYEPQYGGFVPVAQPMRSNWVLTRQSGTSSTAGCIFLAMCWVARPGS